jgi:small subunit ribosomal protein S9
MAKKKIVLTSGRKKTAIARVRIKDGKGGIKVNGVPLEVLRPAAVKLVISEPVKIAETVLGGGFNATLDIEANMSGGGIMGQAYACRTAIGKALVEWSDSELLKKTFNETDRSLIVDDVRRKEMKKYLRKGARAKPIKSYR